MATGANALPLSTLAAMVNRKMNVPISSTAYFRPAAGRTTSAVTEEASGGASVCVMTSMTSEIRLAQRRMSSGPAPIYAPSRLDSLPTRQLQGVPATADCNCS